MIGFYLQIRHLTRFILAIVLAFTIANAYGQEFKMNAAFDSTKILIGDQIKFRIQLEQPKGAIVKVPLYTDKIEDKIEVLKAFVPDTQKVDNHLSITYDYLVTCFDSGEYKLQPIVAPYELGQLKDTLTISPDLLTVVPVETDTITQVKDIKPPLNTPLNFAEIWPYVAGGLLLIAIIILVVYFVRKRKTGTSIISTLKKIEPPHVTALHQLDQLRAEKLWQNNMTKQYYVRLTEIVRAYVERRFEIEAMEKTTDETIDALKPLFLNDLVTLDQLKSLLSLADLVKFAKAYPLPDENEVSMLNAYQFVNNTLPATLNHVSDETSEDLKEDDNQQVFN